MPTAPSTPIDIFHPERDIQFIPLQIDELGFALPIPSGHFDRSYSPPINRRRRRRAREFLAPVSSFPKSSLLFSNNYRFFILKLFILVDKLKKKKKLIFVLVD